MLYWLLYEKLFPFFHPFRIFRYLTFRTAFASLHRAADRALHRPLRHPEAARIPDRPVHPRRRPPVAPEKIRHAHHGRRAHRHRHSAAHRALVRPRQPLRLDRRLLHARLRRHRFCRRLHQGRPAPQPRPHRARQALLAGSRRRRGGRRAGRARRSSTCSPPS